MWADLERSASPRSLRVHSRSCEPLRLPGSQFHLTPRSLVHWPELHRGRSPGSVCSPEAGKRHPDRPAGLPAACSPLTGPQPGRSRPSSPLSRTSSSRAAGQSKRVHPRLPSCPPPSFMPVPVCLVSSQTRVVSDSPADQERVKSQPTLLLLCSHCPPPLPDVPRLAPGTSDPLQEALPSPQHLWAPSPTSFTSLLQPRSPKQRVCLGRLPRPAWLTVF